MPVNANSLALAVAHRGDNRPVGVDHYENFPVASILCPTALRPAVRAIYAFARTADDIADEGDATPESRLELLALYRHDLAACATGIASSRWPAVFGPLRHTIADHRVPTALLSDLLAAFEQDVRNPPFSNRAELLDYCRRSANPVGRLLLHLYGVDRPEALQRSDAVCSALQLANFWQDLGVDQRRGRNYLPGDDLRRFGIEPPAGRPVEDTPRLRALVAELCRWATELMHEGAPLATQLPGRAGWELRAVVQGGLRILEKIARDGFATMQRRPTVGRADLPLLAWRMLRMPSR